MLYETSMCIVYCHHERSKEEDKRVEFSQAGRSGDHGIPGPEVPSAVALRLRDVKDLILTGEETTTVREEYRRTTTVRDRKPKQDGMRSRRRTGELPCRDRGRLDRPRRRLE